MRKLIISEIEVKLSFYFSVFCEIAMPHLYAFMGLCWVVCGFGL